MTDHKAEWVLVPRVPTPEMLRAGFLTGSNELHVDQPADAPGLVWAAMIAAAPSASEGEDGAVGGLRGIIGSMRNFASVADGCTITEVTNAPAAIRAWADMLEELRTRPAAQVAATPKHDEGREDSPEFKSGFALGRSESEFLCGLIADPKCDRCGARNAAEAESMCRPSDDSCPGSSWPLENLWNLATQPAARRVTDEARIAELIAAAQELADEQVYSDHAEPDYEPEDGKHNGPPAKARNKHQRAYWRVRAAIESFAQPAEGVSGG